jgi:hypothetical protein
MKGSSVAGAESLLAQVQAKVEEHQPSILTLHFDDEIGGFISRISWEGGHTVAGGDNVEAALEALVRS